MEVNDDVEVKIDLTKKGNEVKEEKLKDEKEKKDQK